MSTAAVLIVTCLLGSTVGAALALIVVLVNGFEERLEEI
jgi:hypothetical protein